MFGLHHKEVIMNLDSKHKWSIAVLFGVLAFTAFILTDHSIAAFTALGGTFIGLAGWYHKANVDEHKIYNRGDTNERKE